MKKIHYVRLHCEEIFLHTIVERAQQEGVNAGTLLSDIDEFRTFVTYHFTDPEALENIRQQLYVLSQKTMKPKEAWEIVKRLTFCYDQKALRQKQAPLTQQQKKKAFISILEPSLATYLYDLDQQHHFKTATVERTYATAEQRLKGLEQFNQKDGTEWTSEEAKLVLFATGSSKVQPVARTASKEDSEQRRSRGRGGKRNRDQGEEKRRDGGRTGSDNRRTDKRCQPRGNQELPKQSYVLVAASELAQLQASAVGHQKAETRRCNTCGVW